MPMLHVAFQEGFSNDTVVVRINGAEVFRKGGLVTKLQIGYADSFEIQLPAGEVQLDVTVTNKGANASADLRLTQPTYVGVSLDRTGSPVFRVSAEPFGYL